MHHTHHQIITTLVSKADPNNRDSSNNRCNELNLCSSVAISLIKLDEMFDSWLRKCHKQNSVHQFASSNPDTATDICGWEPRE